MHTVSSKILLNWSLIQIQPTVDQKIATKTKITDIFFLFPDQSVSSPNLKYFLLVVPVYCFQKNYIYEVKFYSFKTCLNYSVGTK